MNKKWSIDGFTLKMIAVITMLVDHTGATIFERMLNGINQEGLYFGFWSEHYYWLVWIYVAMRAIGRIAFPIYCFLIVEGLSHTRNVWKYAMRLGVFALISEIPFDLAFNRTLNSGCLVEFKYNNVFLTLFVGLVTIALMKCAGEWIINRMENGKAWVQVAVLLVQLVILALGMLLAELGLHTDYGASGVATIGAIYLLYDKPWKKVWLAQLAGVVTLTLLAGELEAVALVTVPLIARYNGQRGRQLKYFFYGFYPVHLLLLELACIVLGSVA